MGFRTKREAEQMGRRMLKSLGKGWVRRVWKNDGWNVAAHAADFHLNCHYSFYTQRFFCLASVNGQHCGDTQWSEDKDKDHRTPQAAVKSYMREVRKWMKQANEKLAEFEEAAKFEGGEDFR